MATRRIAPLPELDLEEVRRAIRLLEAVMHDRSLLAGLPDEERKALLIAAGRVSRPEDHQARRLVRAFRKAKREKVEAEDRAARAATEIRAARQSAVYVPPSRRLEGAAGAPAERELLQPRTCYVCKTEYRRLHFFYDAMCPECAAFNYEKRFQTAPLHGRVALVTGARVKIGFQASLKLLRAGARVIATTRFPHDAARRYAREEDFEAWRSRLEVHGLDLRHAPSVELFARYLVETKDRLDILLNNAAQTVRRPSGFYASLLPGETEALDALPPELRELLRSHEACKARLRTGAAPTPALPAAVSADSAGGSLVSWGGGRAALGIESSAALSMLPYTQEDLEDVHHVFPEGETDADLQQLDLRARNTWRLALAEVETAEMLEVHLINAVAPFILCARLKPLMKRHRTGEQHIVNVSAMEGVFSRGTKTDKHPHTNMAKAALNMLTLTSARDYIEDGIHMNAVDTGWVTDEDPAVHATRKRDELGFEPPLDIVDGAARICDPVFSGLLTGEHVWGRFLKDYKPSTW
jgi:NAD(P)-dependent dehydrogenase (short-subunit alcohol dehydrogenase family)